MCGTRVTLRASTVKVYHPGLMQRVLFVTAGAVFAGLALISSAQSQEPSGPLIYANRCASCHGSELTGANAPSILTWVRFHVDKEIVDLVRPGHQGVPAQLPDAEMRQLLSEMRKLAGTNPAMATGGYTGSRTAPLPPESFPPSEPRPPAPGIGANSPATITMADGSARTGILLGQSLTSAVLLGKSNTTFTLLSRDGDVFREKPIAPKRDWLMYDGSHTGNRYSTLDQIERSNVQRLAPVWTLPMPETRPQLTPVVVDGIMYVTGWNELQAVDATTGRVLWTYREPRHAGIVSEAGIGVNRGATVLGDGVFMITDHAHVIGFNRFTGQRLWEAEMGSYLSCTARRLRRCPSAICSWSAWPAARRARAGFSMCTARRRASGCGGSTPFRNAESPGLKRGSARRSNMGVAQRGCLAPTIPRSM